jgi:hypothetical protein
MHEFCYCEALKVFKIIYEKNCEKGVKGFDLKRFEKLFKKDMKKKKKKKPNPKPFPSFPISHYPTHRRPSHLSGPADTAGPPHPLPPFLFSPRPRLVRPARLPSPRPNSLSLSHSS